MGGREARAPRRAIYYTALNIGLVAYALVFYYRGVPPLQLALAIGLTAVIGNLAVEVGLRLGVRIGDRLRRRPGAS